MDTTSNKKTNAAGQRAEERIEEALERKNITFDALFRLFEKLGTTLDLKMIVRLFLMTLAGQLKLRRVALYLRNPEKGRFDVYHHLGIGAGSGLDPFAVESVFVSWLKQVDTPVHIDEFFTANTQSLCEDERFLKGIVDEGFAMALSLVDRDDVLGVIFFGGKVTGEPFTEFDTELLQMLARIASITIRNAWLYQAAVRSKMEIERFAKVKKEFINHTSHELRTPLTVLKSAIWSIDSEEPEDGILIDMAKDSVLRLESRVERILSLNDVELNETAFDLERHHISSLIEECLREMLPEIEQKRVVVRQDDRTGSREILIDAAKMRIVLRSVLENAVNFVQQDGNIVVSTFVANEDPGPAEGMEIGEGETVQRSAAAPGRGGNEDPALPLAGGRPVSRRSVSYLVVRVEDDGIGIPAEEIACLAEPFVKASNSTMKNVKGFGIGLSVSQRIVAGHGGRLFCRSDVGQGAAFSIWLPLDDGYPL